MKWIIFLGLLSACTLFQKSESHELESISDDVLRHKEGVEIDIKPLKPT